MSESQQADRPGGNVIAVRVKTLADRESVVQVGLHETVAALVRRGREQLGITEGFQRIIYQGRVLVQDQTVEVSGIRNGHAVHLVDRSPGDRNEAPNVIGRAMAPPNPLAQDGLPVFGRIAVNPSRPTSPSYIRVPNVLNGVPVLSSRYSDAVTPGSYPGVLRPGDPSPSEPHANLFCPQSVEWRIRLIDNDTVGDRPTLLAIIKEIIRRLPFLDDSTRENIVYQYAHNDTRLRIKIPAMPSHIPSPALEKLDFICLWTEYCSKIVSLMTEDNGLVSMLHEVLEMSRKRQADDGLDEQQRNRRAEILDAFVHAVEHTSNSHMKDYERERFKKTDTEEYRRLKIERIAPTEHNPMFMMRHALDVDLSEVSREFRRFRNKFSELEELIENLTEAGAAKFTKGLQSVVRDYRYKSISIFYHYMQQTRHTVAHITHLLSEIDVSFHADDEPQRLLPQHSLNLFSVPYGHSASLTLFFDEPHSGRTIEKHVTTIIEPPRRCSDVGDRVNGDWPYLPYNPPSVSMDAVLANQRRSDAAARNMSREFFQRFFPVQQPVMTGRIVRTVAPAGNAPSVPVETLPPPTEMDQMMQNALSLAMIRENYGPNSIILPEDRLSNRLLTNPNTIGPETEVLHAVPQHLEPNELQRIARNIAMRFRSEALRRIATNLGARFRQESWDTRVEHMPLCTLRECIALVLELICSSGNNLTESKELMLALIRNEDVLIRAITESIKSLFSRGEFPTHLCRFILPRTEAASSRQDYEDVDSLDSSGDERESLLVRVPSDISQPQSGDLRAIRTQRMNRRALLEAQNANNVSTSGDAGGRGASTSASQRRPFGQRLPRELAEAHRRRPTTSAVHRTTPTSIVPRTPNTPPPGHTFEGGPTFAPEDAADIRAGRLPLRRRHAPQQTSSPQEHPQATASAPAAPRAPPTQPAPSGHGHTHAHGHAHLHAHGHAHLHAQPADHVPAVRAQMVLGQGDAASAINILSGFFEPEVIRQFMGEEDGNAQPQPSTSSPSRTPNSRGGEEAGSSQPGTSSSNAADESAANRISREYNELNNPGARPMVSIDPFMTCCHRLCEINRVLLPDAPPNTEQSSRESHIPDPELRTQIAGHRTSERNAERTSQDDPDYNYSIVRTESGQLVFKDLTSFKRFIRTALRSLLSHCIDTDTLMTLNMNGISGYPGAITGDLGMLVRRSVRYRQFTPYFPSENPRPNDQARRVHMYDDIDGPHGVPPPPTSMQRSQARTVSDTRGFAEGIAAAVGQFEGMGDDRIRAIFGRGSPNDNVMLAPLISSDASYMIDYMSNRNNPRAPGAFGFIYDLTVDRFNRRDWAVITRRNQAEVVIQEHEGSIREALLASHLSGRRNHSHSDIHQLVQSFVNNIGFYEEFVAQNGFATTITVGNNTVQTAFVLHQAEIALLKGIFTMCIHRFTPRQVSTYVMRLFDVFLMRTLFVFWILSDKNMTRLRELLRKVAAHVTRLRFAGQQRPIRGEAAFLEIWNRLMEFWIHTHHRDVLREEDNFVTFVQDIINGTEWNDVDVDDAYAARRTGSIRREHTDDESTTPESSANNSPDQAEAQNVIHRTWNQVRRMIQENPVTVMSLALCGWMWWTRR